MAYTLALATLVVAAVAWPLLGQSLLPNLQERDLVVHWVNGALLAMVGRRREALLERDVATLSADDAASGVVFEAIRTAIVANTVNAPKGQLTGRDRNAVIYANDQLPDAAPWNDLIVAYRNGAPVRLRDVGRAFAGVNRQQTLPCGSAETVDHADPLAVGDPVCGGLRGLACAADTA